jgi:hypothetical protein
MHSQARHALIRERDTVSPQARHEQQSAQRSEQSAESKTEEKVEKTEAELAAEKESERNEELLSLSGSEREEKREEFRKEDLESGESLTPEQQRIKEDEDTAAPVGHIPAG